MFAWIVGLIRLKWGFGQNRGRGDAILAANEFVLTFGGYYLIAKFSENRSSNETVRVRTDKTYRCTDANWFYNFSDAICYNYGAHKNISFI